MTPPTSKMASGRPNHFDVAVIGAGVEGSSTAYNLSKMTTGKQIALLEQFDAHHTRGSSHGGSRITRNAYTESYYAEMMPECFNMWSTLEKESGNLLYIETGGMYFGPQGEGKMKQLAETMLQQKIVHEVLTSEEANKRISILNLPRGYHCILEPKAGIIRASMAVQSYQQVFVANGGTILDHCKVESISPGPLVRIHTTRGTLTAKQVVIAAGPWTSKLIEPLHLKLPLQPYRIDNMYWSVDNPQSMSAHCKPCGMPIFIKVGSPDMYGTPILEYPGLVKVCAHGGIPIDPDKRDETQGAPSTPSVKNFIASHFRGVDATSPYIVEYCIYTQTPDEDFIIDKHPSYSNIVIGAGFSGHGFKLSPVVGKLLAELTLDTPPSYSLEHFTVGRFVQTSKL